jgi:hypothetical protein
MRRLNKRNDLINEKLRKKKKGRSKFLLVYVSPVDIILICRRRACGAINRRKIRWQKLHL